MMNLMKMIDKYDMGNSKKIGIGMLGCGVVGSGVVRTLLEKSIAIEQYVQQAVEFRKILVRNIRKPRDWPIEESLLTTDNNAIIDCVDNIYFATGFTGRGLMHSPAVGLTLKQMILKEKLTFDIEAYKLNRNPNFEKYVI